MKFYPPGNFFLLALLCFSLPAACTLYREEPSLTDVLDKWEQVEEALSGAGQNSAPTELRDRFAPFRRDFESYIAAPLFSQYEIAALFPQGREETIHALTAEFEAALAAGDRERAEKTAAGIRSQLAMLRRMEMETSQSIFGRIYYLFFIFMVIIVGLIVFVWRLRRDLWQSRTTEQTSAVFSRMTILAQENERARIAAELHDTVLQDLGRLMQITGPAQSTGGEPLRPLEESLMRNLRGVCTDIMPPDFSRLALTDSLIQLCMDFEKRTGVECRISIEEEADTGNLLPERQLQVYRIVQEALMNIEKHAAATEAVVTVRNFVPPRSKAQVPRKVKLSRKAGLFRKAGLSMLIYVSDDGRGFPGGLEPGSSPGLRNLGLGIRGMYERAAILEADLSFIGGPEDGVTLRLEIPLPR